MRLVVRQMIADGRLLTVGVLTALVLLVSSGTGCDDEPVSNLSAISLLDKMLAAEKGVSYEGMRDLTWARKGRERRSFFFVRQYPGGPTLVESAGRQGGRSRRWVERFGRLYWLADKDLLLENYRVAEIGRRMVSEREGIVLEIASRHSGRPSVEIVIDADFAEFIDDDRCSGHVGMFEQHVQKCCLPASKEAGDHGDPDTAHNPPFT